MIAFWYLLALVASCTAIIMVVLLKASEQQPTTIIQSRENVPARIEEILRRAAYHRRMLSLLPYDSALARYHTEQLEAEADEFAELHGYQPLSREGFVLSGCVVAGHDYESTIGRLMECYR